MKLIDFVKTCNNAKEPYEHCVDISPNFEEEYATWLSIVTSTQYFNTAFDATNNSKVFYAEYKNLEFPYGKQLAAEFFYMTKLKTEFNRDYRYKGIPAKLEYLIRAAQTLPWETPNQLLSMCYRAINEFAPYTYETSAGVLNLLGVFSIIIQEDFEPVTDAVRKVYNEYHNVYEVYVENVDMIAFLPEDIAGCIRAKDLDVVTFDKKIGLLYKNIPLRTLGGRIGLTTDDFDLRNAV